LLPVLLLALLAEGVAFAMTVFEFGDRVQRATLQAVVSAAETAVEPEAVAELRGIPQDAGTAAFSVVIAQLRRIHAAEPNARFVYLMTKKGGQWIFLADAENPSSPDYSPPGQVYTDEVASLERVLATGTPTVVGPYRDSWGLWVTGEAPVKDQHSGKVIAVFGIDIAADTWAGEVERYRWLDFGVSGLLVLAIGVAAIGFRIQARRRATQRQLAAIVQSSQGAIIGMDVSGLITSWNPGAVNLYGYEAKEVVGKPVEILARDDRKRELHQQVEAVLRGEGIANFETIRAGKSGQQVDVSESLSPIRSGSGKIIGASVFASDASPRKQAERLLANTTRAMRTLVHGNEALIRATSEAALFKEMCRVIVEFGGYSLASIGLAQDDAEKTVRVVASAGHDTDYLDQAQFTWEEKAERGLGPTGTAIRTGVLQINRDFARNPAVAPWREEALKRGFRSSIALPLREEARVLGALTIFAPELDAFGTEEVELLSEMANDISYGLSTLKARAGREAALQQLERSMEETVQVVASTVEARDAYAAGHQRRVAKIAEAIALEMGLAADRIHGLRLASVVHDLGETNLRTDMLAKPGKLSSSEYKLIQTHPQIGHDILKSVTFPWPIADIVLQHHERLDGSGYPNGLKGDAILLEARILAVADVVEAMTSQRPNRPALGLEAALTEIEQGSGRLYEPAAVDACVRLFRSGRLALE